MITWSLLTKRKCICQFSDGENVTDVLPFNAGTFGQITRICTHVDISRRPFEHTFPAFLLHSSTLWYTPFNLLAISFDVFEESLSLIPSARQQPPLPPLGNAQGPSNTLWRPYSTASLISSIILWHFQLCHDSSNPWYPFNHPRHPPNVL